jgi:heat shock protein HtpX
LILAGVMNFISYWFSDKLALRMAGAHEVTPDQDPHLHAIVAEVAELAGVPKPKVYVVDTESPNAFATGRNPEHAVVAVTTGIRRILSDRELRAVLGHEIGHVKNRDILTSSIVATIAGAISYLQMMVIWGSVFGGRDREGGAGMLGLLAVIIAPIVAAIIQFAISRTREYQADASGAGYTHDPEGLANALGKLHQGVQMRPLPQTPGAEATAPLYIMHPFRAGEGFSNLFSTHPPIEERIKRLRQMAGYAVD